MNKFNIYKIKYEVKNVRILVAAYTILGSTGPASTNNLE